MGGGEKKIGYKLLLLKVLREYSAILVDLLKVVPYGVGVGGNDANDGTKE